MLDNFNHMKVIGCIETPCSVVEVIVLGNIIAPQALNGRGS